MLAFRYMQTLRTAQRINAAHDWHVWGGAINDNHIAGTTCDSLRPVKASSPRLPGGGDIHKDGVA